jgi:hypothetical protein
MCNDRHIAHMTSEQQLNSATTIAVISVIAVHTLARRSLLQGYHHRSRLYEKARAAQIAQKIGRLFTGTGNGSPDMLQYRMMSYEYGKTERANTIAYIGSLCHCPRFKCCIVAVLSSEWHIDSATQELAEGRFSTVYVYMGHSHQQSSESNMRAHVRNVERLHRHNRILLLCKILGTAH